MVVPARAFETGPQATVRRFCQLDAQGARARPDGWGEIAPLVAWRFEPAWEEVVVIDNYEVTGAEGLSSSGRLVTVRYQVIARVTGDGVDAETFVETVTLNLLPSGDGGWVIAGPSLPPHVFSTRIDPAAAAPSLRGDRPSYLPASGFVRRAFREAGWDLPILRTPLAIDEWPFQRVGEPAPGDLAVFLWESVPFHVGVIDREGAIVSSSLTHGIVRSTASSLPGTVEYRRLARGARAATPESEVEVPDGLPAARLVKP